MHAFGNGKSRDKGFATQEQRPHWTLKSCIKRFQKMSFAGQTNLKIGVREIEPFAQNRTLRALGRVSTPDVLGCVIIAHQAPLTIYTNGHFQRYEIAKRYFAGAAQGRAQ
jgi:hypothetical protein